MSFFPPTSKQSTDVPKAESIWVRGTVKGVGFRPTVYRLAKHYGLKGELHSAEDAVHIIVVGEPRAIDHLVGAMRSHSPPLTHIEAISRKPYQGPCAFSDFTIVPSPPSPGYALTPDVATCATCLQDIRNPLSRHYRYPFTSCAHCGPRLSILQALPYQRAQTSMGTFSSCPDCQQEYGDRESRRFQAQAIACPTCGPTVWIEPLEEQPSPAASPSGKDAIEAVCTRLLQGDIVAIKGLGGFYLACDATHEGAVRKLRQRQGQLHKPLALMAPDLGSVEQHCRVGPEEKALLESPMAPIVLLEPKHSQLPGFWMEAEFLSFHRGGFADQIPQDWGAEGRASAQAAPATPLGPQNRPAADVSRPLAPSIAPRHNTLGFMLPHTPLHHLILQQLKRPIVMTSGNFANQPSCITNEAAQQQLVGIADVLLLHNQEIVNRVDDSIVQVCEGQVQVLRRARGYAPAPLLLPEGFCQAPPLLAMGSEGRNTFCLIHQGQAVLSQHLGNLGDQQAYHSYEQALALFGQHFEQPPQIIAVDQNPSDPSTQLGLSLSRRREENSVIKVHSIQHHHAHVAACMAEHGLALKTPPVLGIVLDSLGFGDDATFWGGEFLLTDYQGYRRLATFKPVTLLGGEEAFYEPWRSTYAQLRAAFDWQELIATCGDLELIEFLADKPQPLLNQLQQETQLPLTSSAERLFDAVAAAIGVCREQTTYKGQGVVELEALVESSHLPQATPYPFQVVPRPEDGLWLIEPQSMWLSLLADLVQGLDSATLAARFHIGLASAIATLTHTLQQQHGFTQVALTGGVFQNKVLARAVKHRLEALGLVVLTHSKVPPNDGGLSLGQAVIAAARQMSASS